MNVNLYVFYYYNNYYLFVVVVVVVVVVRFPLHLCLRRNHLKFIFPGKSSIPPTRSDDICQRITFNPVARQLEQAPLPELQDLRGQHLGRLHGVSVRRSKGRCIK